jgi:peptidoglycan/LPS O-acetylase OafA/YrhL
MAAIALGPYWLRSPFVNRAVRSLGEPSYSVYLIHLVVAIYVGGSLLEVSTDGSPTTIALWFATVIPISLAYAYLMVWLVERPSRAWATRADRVSAVARPGVVRPAEAYSGS